MDRGPRDGDDRPGRGPRGSKTRRSKTREKRKSRPLDRTVMRDLALSYVARFATTGAKLEAYLARKIRERGVAEDGDGRSVELDVPGLVADFVDKGYVDDDAYARARARDLTGRGFGARRVEQALWAAGVEEEVRADHAPDEGESRNAAVLLAKKRRFGPFGIETEDGADYSERSKKRDKQIAAMLRAGHSFTHAAFIVDAAGMDEIEDWLAEAQEDDMGRTREQW